MRTAMLMSVILALLVVVTTLHARGMSVRFIPDSEKYDETKLQQKLIEENSNKIKETANQLKSLLQNTIEQTNNINLLMQKCTGYPITTKENIPKLLRETNILLDKWYPIMQELTSITKKSNEYLLNAKDILTNKNIFVCTENNNSTTTTIKNTTNPSKEQTPQVTDNLPYVTGTATQQPGKDGTKRATGPAIQTGPVVDPLPNVSGAVTPGPGKDGSKGNTVPSQQTGQPKQSTPTSDTIVKSSSTTLKPPTKVTKCVRNKFNDVYCIEIIDDNGKVIIRRIKNDKPISTSEVTEPNRPIRDIIEEEFEEFVPDYKTTTKVISTKTRCIIKEDKTKICIKIVDDNGKVTVTTIINEKVVDERITTGDVEEILEEETRRYVTVGKVSNPVTKPVPIGSDAFTPGPGKDDSKGVTTPSKQTRPPVDPLPNVSGAVTPGPGKQGTKPVTGPSEQTGQPKRSTPTSDTIVKSSSTTLKPPTKVTKCVRNKFNDVYCIEIIDDNGKVIIRRIKNDKPISTSEVTEPNRPIRDIIEEEFEEFVPDYKTSTKVISTKTRCIIKEDKTKICIEIVDDNGKVTITTKVNDKVVDVKVTTGNIEEILEEETKKYVTINKVGKPSTTPLSGGSGAVTPGPGKDGSRGVTTLSVTVKLPVKVTKCVRNRFNDVYCIEIIDENGKVILKKTKNDKPVSVEEVSDAGLTSFEIIDEEFKEFVPDFKTAKQVFVKKSRCFWREDKKKVCVEVVDVEGKVTVTWILDDEVVDVRLTGGDIDEVLEEEVRKLVTVGKFMRTTPSPMGSLTTKLPINTRVSKCVYSLKREVICVEIYEDQSRIILKTTRDDEVIGTRIIDVSIVSIIDLLDSELRVRLGDIRTLKVVLLKKVGCLVLGGDNYCLEIVDSDEIISVTIRVNGRVTSTRKTRGNVFIIFEEELTVLIGSLKGTTLSYRNASKCVTVLTDYIVCVEVTETTEGIRVVIRRNRVVIKEFITVGILLEVLTKEISKYTVTSVFPKVNKCLKLSTGDTICVEGIIIGDVVLVNRMKNGKIITSKDLSGEISVIVEEDLTEYFKEVSTRQITVVTTTKCLFFNGTVAYCVEVTQTGRKLTVTVMKNGFIVITRETEGNILSIIEEEFIKLFEIEKIKITKSTKTQCITVLTDYIVCVEVTEITEGIRVVIRRNGLVIKEFITVGNLLDILLREINKYIVKNVIPKVTKCLKLSTRDTICAEGIIVGDVVILNRMKNGKIVATEDVQGDVDVSVEDELTEYFQDVSKPSIAVQTTTKCRFFNGTVAYCVEIVQSGKKLTVTVMKNGFVVEESETEGNIVDIIEEEFIKLFINEKIKDYKAAKSTNRCKTLSSGDKICVEVIEDAGKLIVTVKKNGKIIHARETRGNLADVLESELFKYTNEDDSIEVAKGVVKGKTMTKCASTNTGDKICVDIKDEGQYLTVIIKKNESVIVTKQVTGSATNVLNQELQNYINQLSNPNHSGSSSKKKCMILPNRDQICVEINNFAGMNMAKITRNGILIRSKPHRFGRPEDILLEEVNALRNG
jgi:hypothetical protein